MAARPISEDEFKKALELYCLGSGVTASEGEDHGLKRFLLSPGDIIVRLEEGRIITDSQSTFEKISEILMEVRQSEPAPTPANNLLPADQTRKIANIQKGKTLNKGLDALTTADIINYINPKATEADAWLFLRFCQEKKLNPITKEAYLVIFEGKDGRQVSIITGKEAFTKRAEAHPQFDGFKAGIIVRNEAGEMEDREGTFILPKEELLGGWAEVYRKDRKVPFRSRVSLKEYNTGRRNWLSMPATMIRKVPLVQSLREAFTGELGGCYDQAEMDQAIVAEYEVGA